jgi:hypothetical protein
MSLKLKVSEDLKTAMKEKNAVKLSILRVLKGEIERQEQTPNGKIELPDGNIVSLIKKLVEGIKETTNNQDEIAALDIYLPKQLTQDAMLELIAGLKANGVTSMGEFMKHFKTNFDGQYDGKVLSNLVKLVLS